MLLGKAYGLGRAIAETAMLPANAITDEQRAGQFRCMFDAGRMITIKDWLADLKTLLPDHTAYAVSRSLHDWQGWVAGAPDTADWAGARSAIRVQGGSATPGWLWQTELDGSVALAATCLPPGVKKSPVGGSSVGRLIPAPDRAPLQRRDQLRREADEDTLTGTD